MESRNGTEWGENGNQDDNQRFLRGIYRKAAILEYERMENERVLANHKTLRKQWLIRTGTMMGAGMGFIMIMKMSSFAMTAVLPLSSVLIMLGLLLEHIELRMAANQE